MLTLNEKFAVPDADHAWSVINDLNTLVPCVPGARVKSVDSPQAVKAQIEVRMGAMGMTFTGPVNIASTDPASRSVTIKANTRETLGQSYATGDITIRLGDGHGTISAIANVGGKAAGLGEGVIVNVLTDLVRSFSANVASAVDELAHERRGLREDPEPGERSDVAQVGQQPGGDRRAADAAGALAAGGDGALELVQPPAVPERAGGLLAVAPSGSTPGAQDPAAIFRSLTSRFGGRLDVRLTSGPDDAPLLKAGGQSFAMLHGGELVVRLHPGRCAELVESGKGRLFAHDGQKHEDWLVVDGLDAAEWTGHTMEALAFSQG
ncbi:MAG: SRPBCC domain-containing protein [Actinomycetota bacterium]|nr:SRPBCC domain-containing protein [Actinomycetota bacterium]